MLLDIGVLLAATMPQPGLPECRLESGKIVPCGDDVDASFRRKHLGSALRSRTTATKERYEVDQRRFSIDCIAAPGGICHVRVADGARQQVAAIPQGRAHIFQVVPPNARWCADVRVVTTRCRGLPVFSPAAKSMHPRQA